GSRDSGLTLVHDISERKEWELQLQAAYEEAKRAVEERNAVLAVVSHDLRNPLSTMNMAASLMLEAIPEEKKMGQAVIVRRSVDQMKRLIEDLLEATSIEGGGLRVTPTPVPVAELIATAAEAL